MASRTCRQGVSVVKEVAKPSGAAAFGTTAHVNQKSVDRMVCHAKVVHFVNPADQLRSGNRRNGIPLAADVHDAFGRPCNGIQRGEFHRL